MNPDTLACQALLNCLIREVSAPEEQAWEDDGHLLIRLARSGAELRAGLRRRPAGIAPRPAGWVQLRRGASWQTIGWQRLADLVAGELTLATGVANPEFGAQVRDSHASVTAILAARAGRPATPQAGPGGAGPQAGPGGTGQDRIGRYLASEQALIAGHRFHPSPKARQGAPRDWLRYAPEAGAGFPLRFLGVRDEVLAAEGDCTGLDRLGAPVPPPGYRVLPAHPWQFRLLAGQPWLRDALRRGLVVDLGDGSREVAATSSVRTVYDPGADVFCKFSLNVRITNCVRKSAWYELAGAVALTRLLRPVFAELASRFGGTVLLGEPGYRTAALSARDAYEGLAVIVRDGVRAATAPDVTPLLAASLTEPAPGLFDGRERDWLLAWWQAYVRAVAPPVLGAFFWHGVVLEPHLQNVLIGVDGAGWPVQAIFRDLEGTKLVASRHAALLAGLAPGIARGLAYDDRRGWDRVAYCLLVNHLSEVAAAIADRQLGKPAWEHELWRRARQVLTDAAAEHGWPPQLRAVLAGVPLPAKANLRLRWARDDAGPRAMGGLPAYVYDLTALDAHAARIRAALPRTTELYYAVKANPDAAVLRTIARHADGFEVSSGGELEHANAAVPGQPRAFGGPGKTAAELAAALRVGVTRFHVESPLELSMLAAAAQAAGVRADILLRVNPPGPAPGASAAGPAGGSSPGELAALVMGEQPSPFGMDLVLLDRCAETLARLGNGPLRLRGLHAHLASGLDAAGLLAAAGRLLAFGRDWCARHHVTDPEFNLGGGMAVDYRRPEVRFDWDAYGRGLARLARPGETLRIEPGRAVTAYCGWYLTRVLDVKHSHGQAFAVVAGGTHHLRTPAAKGHDQPFAVVPVPDWAPSWPRPGVTGTAVTITGQLCTPKDVLARQVTVPRLRAGDVVAFGLAGAYAWNISHHGFLMHPPPAFHYLPQLA